MIRRFFILIIALLLCYTVWWVGPLIAIGSYFPLGDIWVRKVIITLILCWALWPFVAVCLGWVFRYARAPLPQRKKKTVQLDRVSARFFDALRTLQHVSLAGKKSRWQRWRESRKRQYIDEKPWFLVIGPPGCGKTSLIYESGEHFLLSEQYGLAQTSDMGPTQDCNLWLTERAVYIDTAGEWILLHGQSEEAGIAKQKLFSMIRKHRRYPGIDAVILCLDAEMLLNAPLIERKSLADTLRVRIQEVAASFHTDIAVYLLLNGIDKLPGGEAFLSLIGEDILSEGLGISLTCNQQGHNNFADDEARYQEFQAKVSRYVLEILHDAPSTEVRQQLLLFTESLGALQKPLFNLFEQVFPATPIGYSGSLRQFWLGSTLTLSCWDDMFESRQMGAVYYPALSNAITERGVLHASGPLPLRNRLMMIGRYVLVTLVLSLLLLMLSTRYFWEYDYIAYASARFEETKRIVRDIPLTNQINDDLVAAFEQLGYVNTQFLESSPPLLTPYFEHRLLNRAMLQTYHRHLNKIFWPAVENYITHELRENSLSGNDDGYETLKVYLMLGHPEHRSPDELVNWFMGRWNDFAPQGYTLNERNLFSYHLRELFSDASATALQAKLDEDLIRTARIKAMRLPIHIRVVQRIQDKPLPARIENITLADMAGPSVALMMRRKSPSTVTDVAIPGFYTRASYHDVFLAQLQEASQAMINEQTWVLSDGKDSVSQVNLLAAAQKLSDEARKYYLLEYANQWENFLNDIRVRPINGLDDAALLARQFSDPSSPLANLVRFATRETTLSADNQGNVTGWFNTQRNKLQQARRTVIDEMSGERSRFRLTPEKTVEDRFELLRRLGFSLQKATTSNSDPLANAFEQIYNQLITLSTSLRAGQVLPKNNEFNRLQIDMARQPEPVRSVMVDLLATAQIQSLQQSKENLSKGVSSIASDLCHKTISGRYPFTRSAKEEVGIGDFSRMFSQGGAMQTFFEQNLAPYVDTHGSRWQVKPESSGVVTAKTLQAFENASLIRDTFFDASGNLAMSMIIRPISLSPNILEAVLDVDGQILTYSHGYSQPMRVDWPGPKGGVYIRLTFKTQSGNLETVSFDGPWAIFHMYDATNPVRLSSNSRELTIAMSSISGFFKVELSSTMRDYPLWSQALSQFSCPQSL
ncbi:type VI secretion system membrane subunit TssM [Serratia sp. UGAL515B_01]|uniref:type VI secretion system membrane subunit TssM n=1 Tax=Serratia sp. UGAL515B_01 TaxID=2986763 RepID=UPI0029530936|nr:type VI secretion system membrane subunit TssM [Serratia sp. UGAL515B_01]WON77467.1 type VI secretion system membrane subunit TssM [Serratia sp. UGAL515B_01]